MVQLRRLLAICLVPALLGSCGEGAADETVTVFAAASLTDVFRALADEFEAGGGPAVTFNFGGSSSLREQILAGAPVDVFASANPENMELLEGAGLVAQPEVFASNQLAIAVAPGNPADIRGLADFAEPSLLLGLCAVEVPCGAFARASLEAADVDPTIDTEEPDVRSLLTKIAAGELDAGVVYETDIRAASDVEGIEIPDPQNVSASYSIAVTTSGSSPDLAESFVAFVRGDAGQEILARFGFGPP